MLRRSIESVLNQSFKNFEQIIIDDGNEPETASIVAGYHDSRLRYIPNKIQLYGPAAKNAGIDAARGEFISFLDDDDEYLPGILESACETFQKVDSSVGFIWTGITRVRDEEHGEEVFRNQFWPEDFPDHEEGLMVSTAIGGGFGVFIKRKCLKETGNFDVNFPLGFDTDMMMRLLERYQFRTVPKVLVKIHHHNLDQMTGAKNLRTRMECYQRIIEQNFTFLSAHWKAFYIHTISYTTHCYRFNKRFAGRKALFSVMKKYPGKAILYADLITFELFGKDFRTKYPDSRLKKYLKF